MLVEVDNEGIRCSAIEKRPACLCARRCATVPIACNHGRGSGWLDNHNPSPLHHSHGGNRHRASDHRGGREEGAAHLFAVGAFAYARTNPPGVVRTILSLMACF